MNVFSPARLALGITTLLFTLHAQAPETKEALPEIRSIPPRTSPSDYQFHTKVGSVTLAAEFTGHALPTPDGPLTTEDYVAVELALYGPKGAKFVISTSDFSLRIKGKKNPLPGEPFAAVFSSLKDPEWESPEAIEKKSKTSLGTGGQGQDSGPPPPAKVPVKEQRKMAQRVQRAALPTGERELPQAGLIFFSYHGKTKNIKSLELVYNGPAGKASLALQP